MSAFLTVSLAMSVLAFVYDGTETADLDLNDGGVWVTYLNMDGSRSVAAHLNYPSRTLDSYTEPPSSDFDVSQTANDVVVHDRSGLAVASVNTATWLMGSLALLPKGAEAVQGGSMVAIADPNQGKVWAVPATSAEQFTPENKPLLQKRPGVRATVGVDEVIHTVAADGTLEDIVRTGESWTNTEVGTAPKITDGDEVTLTAVGDVGVVVNHTAGWVAWPDHEEKLAGAEEVAVQQPGAESDTIALATPNALLQISLDGGGSKTTEVKTGGQPIAPVTVGECTYAAWTITGDYVRDCLNDDEDIAKSYPQLERPGATPEQMVFRVNRDVVVLNDSLNGDILLVNEDMAVVNDWAAIRALMDSEDKKKNSAVVPTEFQRTKENHPPRPKDDLFGVRAGQTVSLPVLANDTDPDGDVLLASVKNKESKLGEIEQVRNGRALRITVPSDATGGDRVTYTASDGRPEGDQDAGIQLEVHDPSVNGSPQQIPGRDSNLEMVQRGTAGHHILQEWFDPDGDPFWIEGVNFPKGMDGVFRPDGLVKVTDDGTQEPGTRVVKVSLTDGRQAGTVEAELKVTVKQRGLQIPPVANADYVKAVVGEPIQVSPLANDTDANGDPLFVTKVADVDGGKKSQISDEGTFTFTGTKAEAFYADYSISDGPEQASGVIRIDVVARENSQALPVPDNDIAVLPASGQTLVDVLGNDTDPLGGVLVLQSVGQADGVKAAVVNHSILKIESTGLGRIPAKLDYVVANASGPATGSVTVIASQNDNDGTPLAYDDKATVRSGDIVTVDVMSNDVSPGERELHVGQELVFAKGSELGTAFVADDKVRFKAEGKAGTARVKYTITDPDENASTGTLSINVMPETGSNEAPSPQPITARLVQGGQTDLQVPLDGIDPDGDSATLLGLKDAPTKGVALVSAGVITYTASTGSGGLGTDSFSYLVEDRFGAQAEGRVNVGVAQRPATDSPPITTPDTVAVRPERLLSVPVLLNDIDPEGEALGLVDGSVDPTDEGGSTKATVEKGRAQLTTPQAAGVLRYDYRAVDPAGNATNGDLVVEVSPDAPLQPPAARDDIVPLAEIVGKDRVQVQVLENDEDPDGAASVLVPSSETAGVTADELGVMTVPLTTERQVIVYSVTDEDGQVGKAVIVVPDTDSLAAERPVVRADAPLPIKVKAGELVEIPIADYVAVRKDRSASVPFTENIWPGPGWDGSKTQKDPTTLLYRSTPDFYGPTAVTFLASDEDGKSDKDSRTAVLTLPIEVEAGGHTKPELILPTIFVTPGEDPWTLDLREAAFDPDPGDQEKLSFEVAKVGKEIFAEMDGSVLKVSAESGAPDDFASDFTVNMSDGENGVKVEGIVKVISSTRPLMSVRNAVIEDVNAGDTVDIDVADYVTNPFADDGEPIKLVGPPQRSEPSAALDVTGGTTFNVTPDKDWHGTLRVSYVVADATGESEREKQGQITLQVRGNPDAPTGVIADATESHTVEVDWRAPANNGAPITAYRLEWSGGSTGKMNLGNVTSATVGGLTNAKKYHFRVIAINEVEESEPSAYSGFVTPDDVPQAPLGVKLSFGDGDLLVTWNKAEVDGSRVKDYEISYSNNQPVRTNGPATRITLQGLTNGTDYQVRVRGINDSEPISEGVQGAGAWSVPEVEHPNGVPAPPTTVNVLPDGPDANPSAEVSWPASPNDNGHEVSKYEVRKQPGGATVCRNVTDTTCRVDLVEGEDSTFSVRANNRENRDGRNIDGWGAWSEPSTPVRGAKLPGTVGNLAAQALGTKDQAKITFSDAARNGAESVRYIGQIGNGANFSLSSGQTVSGFSDGQDRVLHVRAISTANGIDSPPSEARDVTVRSFSPCTGDVWVVSNNYNNVTFGWEVVSHGRPCVYSGDRDGRVGNLASAGNQFNKGGGVDQDVTARITIRTETNGSDRAVASIAPEATGHTWKPWADWGAGNTCTSPTIDNCRYFTLRLTGWQPNSLVRCTVGRVGNNADWSADIRVNSSGEWGRTQIGAAYNDQQFNPDNFDGPDCDA